MRGSLIAAALLAVATYCGNAQAQTPSDVAGRTPDLNIRIVDLVTRLTDLNFAVQDLRFAVVDLGGKPVEMAGKTEALNVKETATEIRIELAADVLFDFDKADIRQDAASALHQVADIIRDKGRGRAVRIEGHTDAKGSADYNLALSQKRAEAVRQYLIANFGIDGKKLVATGMGFKHLKNAKDELAAENRRVQIVNLSKDQGPTARQ